MLFKITFVMKIQKTSEKVIIWMHREGWSIVRLAEKMGITRQALSNKLKNNYFTVGEIIKLKSLGFRDE